MQTAILERYRNPPLLEGAADFVLERILREISVAADVLTEAKKRRDLVREIAMLHPAARRSYNSGSIAHGTHNSPLGDADCGVVIDRRVEGFRSYGPDAGPGGHGPEAFYQAFAEFIEPRLRKTGYAHLDLDLAGNRAIKFMFNEPIEFGGLGIVDPYVDLIVALRRDGEDKGLWIPNRRANWWDPANPERHTWLMTKRDPETVTVHRAHEVRLGKRAVKRDAAHPGGLQVICSWNLSALSLDLVTERRPLAIGLAEFLQAASASIAAGLTDDPAGVAGPIELPKGVTQEMAARRLAEMADVVWQAVASRSEQGAEASLAPLFGTEIESIRRRDVQRRLKSTPLHGALANGGEPAAVASALGATVPLKRTASDGS
jgi:hypothetical protein